MSASEHEVIRDLLADLLNEQRATTAAISSLAVAIANAGSGSPAVKAQADAVIEKAAAPAPTPAPAPKPVKAAAAPKPQPAEPVASATPPVETAPAQPTAASPVSTPAVTMTYDQVAAIVIKFSKANGRPAAVEAMKPFGITSLTQAKPEQYAAIAAAMSQDEEALV